MSVTKFFDELAAGDEVMAVAAELEQVQRQLESLGASPAPRPLGHILVPRTGTGVALPSGKAAVDFDRGVLSHEDLGVVLDNLVKVSDLVESHARQPQLRNIIFHADTVANIDVGHQEQEIFFQNVPIPESDFSSVEISLSYPGEVTILASTQRLPIGLGAVTVNGARHGEHTDAVTDSFEAVPVAPFSLWDDHGATYAEAPVYTAFFDTATWTVENTGAANELVAIVEPKEATGSSSAKWREIARDTIPNGDHSVFHVSERHNLQRVSVKNTTAGQSIGASVDLLEANP